MGGSGPDYRAKRVTHQRDGQQLGVAAFGSGLDGEGVTSGFSLARSQRHKARGGPRFWQRLWPVPQLGGD